MSAATTACNATCIPPVHVTAQGSASAEWMMLFGLFLLVSHYLGEHLDELEGHLHRILIWLLVLLIWLFECISWLLERVHVLKDRLRKNDKTE